MHACIFAQHCTARYQQTSSLNLLRCVSIRSSTYFRKLDMPDMNPTVLTAPEIWELTVHPSVDSLTQHSLTFTSRGLQHSIWIAAVPSYLPELLRPLSRISIDPVYAPQLTAYFVFHGSTSMFQQRGFSSFGPSLRNAPDSSLCRLKTFLQQSSRTLENPLISHSKYW